MYDQFVPLQCREIVKPEKIASLTNEAKELTAIFTAQGKTAKQNIQIAVSKIKSL